MVAADSPDRPAPNMCTGSLSMNNRLMSYASTVGFHPPNSSRVWPCATVSVHISVEAEALDPDSLREILETKDCGSIVSFIGITRGQESGSKVERLEFDHWGKELPVVLERIGTNAIADFEINSVVIAHRIGIVLPSEPIVCIHVASPHRVSGFEACSWIMDELKSQAPIWKKEITSDGESWKSGLG